MSRLLGALPTGSLAILADALDGKRLCAPFAAAALQRFVGGMDCGPIASELARLSETGFTASQIAIVLRALRSEREETQRARDEIELVWTGPEAPGTQSRDTSVVMRELFLSARSRILLSSYALSHATHLLAPLCQRMDREPDLSVRLFVHVARPRHDRSSESELLRRFADQFREKHWPGSRLPEVFYDPRTLAPREPGDTGTVSLHAKCVVIDEQVAFVTSANFTEAAQQRNIEAGVIVRQPGFAKSLVTQFERLVSAGKLQRVPGMG